MKKILVCVLIILILISIAACKGSLQLPTETMQLPDPPTKAELAVKFGIPEAEIDEAHQAYPQVKTDLSSEAPIADGGVIIMVYPFANKYKYSADDFTEIGCISVSTLMEYCSDKTEPSRMLLLEFNGDVRNAVLILQDRADIYLVQPDYEMTLH